MRARNTALREGRDAAIVARLRSRPVPPNPYARGSKRALYYDWGAERAERLIDQIMEIGR